MPTGPPFSLLYFFPNKFDQNLEIQIKTRGEWKFKQKMNGEILSFNLNLQMLLIEIIIPIWRYKKNTESCEVLIKKGQETKWKDRLQVCIQEMYA